jgi:predicted nucleic acid-binding protein
VILYLDTSALFKLYVDEAGGDVVHAAVVAAETVAVCRIAWAEAMSALARRGREVSVDQDALEQAKQALRTDWPHFLVVDVSQRVVEQAGEFADTFALRGYDSVQLTSAYLTQQRVQQPVTFACFDKRLSKAAKILGLSVLAEVLE